LITGEFVSGTYVVVLLAEHLVIEMSVPTVTQISLQQKERNTKDGKTGKPIIMIGLMIIS